jgi:16S rRNA (cytosine967-C5)-methyltransferase
LEALVPLQLSILKRAASIVPEGGTLIYATCSVLKAENQGVVDTFLKDHGDWHLAEITQTTPADHGCDGLFAAKLTRAFNA